MRWTLKTKPDNEPLELGDVLRHLNMAGSCDPAESYYLTGLIAKARNYVEQSEDRQLITATWLAYMDRFGYGRQVLEVRGRLPLQSVESIFYWDVDGVRVEYDAADYQVDAVDVDKPGRIRPVLGTTWPKAGDRMNAVEFELKCGYGDTPEAIPKTVREALLYLVGEMYAVREPISSMRIERIPQNMLDVALDLLCWGDYK